jgi:hypothetical protein
MRFEAHGRKIREQRLATVVGTDGGMVIIDYGGEEHRVYPKSLRRRWT